MGPVVLHALGLCADARSPRLPRPGSHRRAADVPLEEDSHGLPAIRCSACSSAPQSTLRPLGPSRHSGVLALQSWLLQSFYPGATEQALQVHCWFLSCMVLYWLLFRPAYNRLVRPASLGLTLGLLAALSLLPWLVVALPPAIGKPFDWYSEHSFGDASSAMDLLVVTLKFHPLAYAHVFLFGMLLARLRKHLIGLEETEDAALATRLVVRWGSWVWRYGATLGYMGLLAVFLIEPIRPMAHKLSARLSVLMPLQGLLLLGLSLPNDRWRAVFPMGSCCTRGRQLRPVRPAVCRLRRVAGPLRDGAPLLPLPVSLLPSGCQPRPEALPAALDAAQEVYPCGATGAHGGAPRRRRSPDGYIGRERSLKRQWLGRHL